jgi:hypothetical protein
MCGHVQREADERQTKGNRYISDLFAIIDTINQIDGTAVRWW